MSRSAWRAVIRRLRAGALLIEGDDDEPLATHPIISEYFADAASRRHGGVPWLDAHERLYRYFIARGNQDPLSTAGMQHYYTALLHASKAGLHELALREVYDERVARGDEFYSTRKLGLVSDDLAALGRYFERPWDTPLPSLTRDGRAFVLHQAGVLLMTTAEMMAARTALLKALDEYRDWGGGYESACASNLCQLHVMIGELGAALQCGLESLRIAEAAGSLRWQIGARSDVGAVLHQMDRTDEALRYFEQAEELEPERWLYSFPGFRYCELLIELDRADEVEERARWALDLATDRAGLGLLHIGFARILLGWSAVSRAPESETALMQARKHLEAATDAIRRSGHRDHLPRALLALGNILRRLGALDAAEAAVLESQTITVDRSMNLFVADGLIESAHLRLARGDPAGAISSLVAAETFVRNIGYRRREKELAALRASI